MKDELSEALLRGIFWNAPCSVYLVQKRGFRFVNRRFQADTGYIERDLLGKDSLFLVFPDDRDTVAQCGIEMLKGKRTEPYEFRTITKTGEVRHVLGAVLPVSYEGQRAALGYYMDVTESKRAFELLKQREARYRAILDSLPDGISIATGTTPVFVNQSLVNVYGMTSASEVVGRPFQEFLVEEDREMVRRWAEARQRGDQAPGVYQCRVQRPDGEIRRVEVAAAIITWGGKPASLAIIRDITDRLQVEEKLIQREREIQALNRLFRLGIVRRDQAEDDLNRVTSGVLALAKQLMSLVDKERQTTGKAVLHLLETEGNEYDKGVS